jgi:hypothetical protein
MTRAGFLHRVYHEVAVAAKDHPATNLRLIAGNALYISHVRSKVLLKFEVVATGERSKFNALRATVLSKTQQIDTQLFPFSIMDRKPINASSLDSELHIWVPSTMKEEDWYTTEPVSYDPLINEIINYCEMWHDLPQ